MKEIKLTQGKVALVDDEDYEMFGSLKWCVHRNKKILYAKRRKPNTKEFITVFLHREIMSIESGMYVDHIDGNGLNCQKSNLRVCTKSQNGANFSGRGASKYRGVSLTKSTGRWSASIAPNGKGKHIGFFNTEENAAIAYNIFAEKHYGEFATYNTSKI